jgi:hypothetical protein
MSTALLTHCGQPHPARLICFGSAGFAVITGGGPGVAIIDSHPSFMVKPHLRSVDVSAGGLRVLAHQRDTLPGADADA